MFEILLQSILIWNSYNILNIETMNRVKRCFRIIDMMLMRIPHCCFLSIHKCYYQKTVLVSNLYTHVITYVLFELSWLSIKIQTPTLFCYNCVLVSSCHLLFSYVSSHMSIASLRFRVGVHLKQTA